LAQLAVPCDTGAPVAVLTTPRPRKTTVGAPAPAALAQLQHCDSMWCA
jgi:hypothetical protein